MFCVCKRTMVVRSCIYFCSIWACYHLRVVFSKKKKEKRNLANTGHTQLSGAASVSLLKIPLIIIPLPLPRPHLAEENVLHCFHSPRFWHFFWFWWYLMLSDSIYFKAKHSHVWSLVYLTLSAMHAMRIYILSTEQLKTNNTEYIVWGADNVGVFYYKLEINRIDG